MPLIYSCIVPHSPVLMPTIGKDHLSLFEKTLHSLESVRQKLIAHKPDTLLVIAPHSSSSTPNHLSIHVPETYKGSFAQFGDLITELSFTPDTVFADQLKECLHQNGSQVAYDGDERIEYSTSVPLFYITKGLNAKVLVVHPGQEPLSEHYAIGKALQSVLQESSKRIAVIASGELSHCLTEQAPGGFSPAALKFDQELVGMLKAQRVKKLVKLDPKYLLEFGICCVQPALLALGSMHDMAYKHAFYSYEYPLGVGHLVMDFNF